MDRRFQWWLARRHCRDGLACTKLGRGEACAITTFEIDRLDSAVAIAECVALLDRVEPRRLYGPIRWRLDAHAEQLTGESMLLDGYARATGGLMRVAKEGER